MRTRLLPLLLVALALGVPPEAAVSAGKRAACRPPNVVGHSATVARRRIVAAHCKVAVTVMGDMGTGPARVVRQFADETPNGYARQHVEVTRRGGRCRFAAPYWKVVARNETAIVAHTGGDADRLWVCVRGTGERRWLGSTEDMYPDWEGFVGMRLAGPWLAYSDAHSGRSGASSTIVLANLGPQGSTVCFPGPTEAVPKEIVVNEAGDTAWSNDPDPAGIYVPVDGGVSVRPHGGPTRQVLAAPAVRMRAEPITGLSIDATTVRWEDAGVPGSAPILADS